MPRPALRVSALVLLAALAAAPRAAADSYARCPDVPGADLVEAARVDCADVVDAATAAAAAPAAESPAALTATGWTPYRARPATRGGFDLIALRGKQVLRLRLPGRAPDLDGFAAGRELVFSRATIVGGAPIPRDSAFCTAAFTVRLQGGRLGGLSAAHCAGVHSDGTTQRRNAALRRRPSPGIVLGRVIRVVSRKAPLDALALPVPASATRSTPAVVDRGISRPPWIVAGTAQLTDGRRVCYTGRTSGVDRCGRLTGRSGRFLERYLLLAAGTLVRCTTVAAAPGDSGGPVYTAPRADGTVRAIGLTELITGRGGRMCFTPLAPVLRKLGATLVTGT